MRSGLSAVSILTLFLTSICNAQDDATFVAGFDAFGNHDEFVARLTGGFENSFDDVVDGETPLLQYSVAGWAYTITASGSDLWNATGIVSTRLSADALVLTFSGAPVTAIGGNFWASDQNVQPTGTLVVIELANGTRESFVSSGPQDFRGFIAPSPISSVTIDAPSSSVPAWSTMDNLIVGSAQ